MAKILFKVWLIALLLYFVAITIAFNCVIVFPWFNYIPTMLLLICMCIRISHRICSKKYLMIPTCLGYVIFGFCQFVFLWFLLPRENHTEFPSPDQSQTIIIEYDYVSRPFLYRKINSFLMVELNTPPFIGAMETIEYTIQWLSDKEIVLSNSFGEQWNIEIAK